MSFVVYMLEREKHMEEVNLIHDTRNLQASIKRLEGLQSSSRRLKIYKHDWKSPEFLFDQLELSRQKDLEKYIQDSILLLSQKIELTKRRIRNIHVLIQKNHM